MLINLLKLFVLASIILMLDYCFIQENIRITTLAICLLIVFYYFDRFVIKRERIFYLEKNTSKIIKAAFIFISYIFFIDLYHGQEVYKTIVSAFSSVIMVILLPIYEDRKTHYNIVRHFQLLMIVSMTFALIQFIKHDNNIILSNIISGFSLISVDQNVDLNQFSNYDFRINGATSNNIAFTLQVSIFIIIECTKFMKISSFKALFGMIASFIILIMTQTRAAIFSIAPIILATQIMFARVQKKYQRATKIIIWVVFIGIGYWILESLVLQKMTYISRNIMEHDTSRFYANWYMSIGVLKESPLFGIAPNSAWDIYFKYGDLLQYGYNPFLETPTHHNQVGFYLRYYGLIGIGLLCWLYVLIFQKIIRAKSFWVGMAICSIFILDLVFSMAHNNKLITSPLLWIFLSLASIDSNKEKEPF